MSKEKRLFFTKMEGAGNDYVYIDTLGSSESTDICNINIPILAQKISDRHFGVGSDGLIIIMPSSVADFRMRMFNADGSEAQMCGNGIRCVAKYLYDKGFTVSTTIKVETLAGIKILYLKIEEGKAAEVTVDMGKASKVRADIPAKGNPTDAMIDQEVTADGTTFKVTGVGMGNPHGVIFVDEITDCHIHHYGKMLETDAIWPEKANIEFVEIKDRNNLRMRVWERGTGETLACGTGACASAVAAYLKGVVESEVKVQLLGGTLQVRYDTSTGHVFMTGPARIVAEGFYFLPDDTILANSDE